MLDQLNELGDIRARSMFGGVGLYCDDVFFGILARDTLFLKVDETNRHDYGDTGWKPSGRTEPIRIDEVLRSARRHSRKPPRARSLGQEINRSRADTLLEEVRTQSYPRGC